MTAVPAEVDDLQWDAVAMTGVGSVTPPGLVPLPSAVAFRPAGHGPSAWYRPLQVRLGGGALRSWNGFTLRGADGRAHTSTYRLPVDDPPPSVLDRFLNLKTDDELLELAQRWGPLGICCCRWDGQRSEEWDRAVHQPHPVDIPGDNRELHHHLAEATSTWYQLSQRLAAFVELFDHLDDVAGTHVAARAAVLGLSWPDLIEVRRFVVSRVMTNLAALGSVRPVFEVGDEGLRIGDLRPAESLLGWLVMQALRCAGSARVCPNCQTVFMYGQQRVYCEKCSAAGVAQRDAARRYRRRRRTENGPTGP